MNKGEMVTHCLDRMGAGRQSNTRLTEKIAAQINAAYSTLCGMQPWGWLSARTAIPFTSADDSLALPTTTHGGATVSKVSRVVFVALQGASRILHYRAELADLVKEGSPLSSRTGGVPAFWCVAPGDDGVTKALLLMPTPGYSDTAIVWYLRSHASIKLVNDTDVPLFPEEYHQFLVEKAMSVLTSMDATYDAQVGATARKEAGLIYRAMMFQSRMAQPAFRQLLWPGHGQF